MNSLGAGSLKKVKPLGSAKVEGVFSPDPESVWESADELTPELFESLAEKYGDKPEWMRITAYREGRHTRTHRTRSELLLNLGGKDYWFPCAPGVYEQFVSKIVTEDRGAGLTYLQHYIRRYREYKEKWPSKRYVKLNRLSTNSFYPESEEDKRVTDVAGRVGLPQDVVDAIFEMKETGLSLADIARELRLSRSQVESALNLVAEFTTQSITDNLIMSLTSGEVSVDEAIGRVMSDRNQSKRAFRVMSRNQERGMKSVRLHGQKPRSPKVRIGVDSI